jgi:TetR/AcrR family transcriptional regulator
MSYVAERRSEEKERRRADIIDAAEHLYASKGWDSVTMEEVARSARLSRALLYVYFRDKEELLFGTVKRALGVLSQRFEAAMSRHARGIDQVEAIGRAYIAYAAEFPHYFDACARFQAHSVSPDPGSNEGACRVRGDATLAIVVRAIENGLADGSIRRDVGAARLVGVSLWAFTHGTIQLAMAKGHELARLGIAVTELTEYVLSFIRHALRPPAA